MSKWTDFRDDVVEILDVEEVTEQMKLELTKQLVESILPSVTAVAENFVTKVKEQGKAESGWCKVRDMLVLPLVINGSIYIVDKVLTKTLEKTGA